MEQHIEAPEADLHVRPDIHITVNELAVTVHRHQLTGLAIKEAAIAQHVPIQVDFVLSEEFPNRKPKIVGDHDVVTVHNRSKFHAVSPDDNS
jgi:hypothetical protein